MPRVPTAAQQEFDARAFLRDLFSDLPDDLLIAVGNLTKPHFVRTPDDALPYVIGKRDIYTRITLLRSRPERRGRAEDSAALPGVWLEVDVAGGPTSQGTVVSGGAPDVRAATDLCHRVLQPTLMVRSGYGVHAYWLFDIPWVFASAAQRELAAQLVASWQRRMRREAHAMGIDKLDATHDLARVLRVPGTLNGKGAEPVPVVLLDDGGPRYSMLEIERHCDPPEPSPIVEEANGNASSATTPEELVKRYPKLARIVHREGDPPGDGTGHAWDWYLACEARRRGISRADAIALLAHARARYGGDKANRTDYLEGTIDKAFAEVPAPTSTVSPADHSSEGIGTWITQQWRDDTDNPIVAGWTKGYGDAAIVYLRRRDDTVLRFPRLADFFEPATHIRRVSLIARAPCPAFTKEQAVRVAQQVIALCDAHASSEVSREELRDWLDVFIAGLGSIVPGELFEPGEARWHALDSITSFKAESTARGVAAQTAAVRDGHHQLWLPAESLMRHIRYVEREQIDWETLNTRMLDLGWERREISQWQPDIERSTARQIRRVFYVQPGEAGEAGEAPGGEAGEE
jgi:hypothetical protein